MRFIGKSEVTTEIYVVQDELEIYYIKVRKGEGLENAEIRDSDDMIVRYNSELYNRIMDAVK